MGRHELEEALSMARVADSPADLVLLFHFIHSTMVDIERKRGLFLETAFGTVRRKLWTFVRDEDEDGQQPASGLSMTQAVEFALDFVAAVIPAEEAAAAEDCGDDVKRERGTIVAMLLYLLGVMDYQNIFLSRHDDLRKRLVACVWACKVPMHVILATLRFREELSFCRRALLPSFESDSEESDDDQFRSSEGNGDVDDDEGDEDDETERDDTRWVAERIARYWGLSNYIYLLNDLGQEFAFSSWSMRGIGVLAYSLFADETLGLSFSTPLLDPIFAVQSALFFVSAYAHTMIVDEHLEVNKTNFTRVKGFKLLQSFLVRCPSQSMHCRVNSKDDEATSFHDLVTRFQERNWIDQIVQGMTSAMVSFPETADRSASLAVLRSLIASIDINDRFWFLKSLALKCPYANVSAVLIDYVRSDTALSWQQDVLALDSPYASCAIVDLVIEELGQAAERDLVLHADLIASCLSLLRFLFIRDKETRTGVQDQRETLKTLCQRLRRRLENKLYEGASSTAHLFLLEAALSSTSDLMEQNAN